MQHNIVLHQHSAALNIGKVNSAILKNAISNIKKLSLCKIKNSATSNSGILNSSTITITIQQQLMKYERVEH